jgi:hypothetical protein
MSKAAVGISSLSDGFEAGKEAAQKVEAELGGNGANLAIIFATTGYDQKSLLRGVRAVMPNATLSGCSGEGVITQAGSDESAYAVSVLGIASKKILSKTFVLNGFSDNATACGKTLATQIAGFKTFKGKVLFLFVDGITGNCTEFLASLKKQLPYPMMIVGGAAGTGGGQMRTTYQYDNDTVLTDSITALMLGGDIEPDVVVSHGCEPVGLELTVTKATGSYLEEIDGKPAWDVCKEYLEGAPDDLLTEDLVHLCIGEKLSKSDKLAADQRHIIRIPVKLDRLTKALFMPGELKTGTKIIMTRRNPERIIENAVKYAGALKERNPNRQPLFMLQFDCVGRGNLLFGSDTSSKVISPMQAIFSPGLAWSGFHTYGEIAPIGDEAYYHNLTVALCALYEV